MTPMTAPCDQPLMPFHQPREDRVCSFWRRFQKDPSGCWLWTGAISDTGYGVFGSRSETQGAHRASYELFVGPIPVGLHIDHLCRVRHCVNPSHLEAVTAQTNVSRGARSRALTGHCRNGHPIIDDSQLYRRANGYTECLTCRRLRDRRTYAKKKQALETGR